MKFADKKSLAFVYVPKTSGTYLNIKSIPDEKTYVNNYRPSSIPAAFHMPASRVEEIVGKDVDFFTVLRDPYDRTCSEYYFFKRQMEQLIKRVNDSIEVSDPKIIKILSVRAGKIMSMKSFEDKIYNIYMNKMSVEDYLEWSTENPTYPQFYDTKTPKDFDLVGITENISQTRLLLKNRYGIESGDGTSNNNPNKKIGNPYRTKYLRSNFKRKNPIEYDLYYEGMDKFYSQK
jgi:hypothetical protein